MSNMNKVYPWDLTMTDDFKEILKQVHEDFEDHITLMTPTGSRYFEDHNEDSDYDVVILVKDIQEAYEASMHEGYETCGEDEYGIPTEGSDLYICRKGLINLIFVSHLMRFTLWGRCTKVANDLKVNREDRKVLFSTVLGYD